MECRLLLDVVIAQGAAILQLFTSENKSLLVGWDTFLILDLRLNIVNCVRRLNLQRNSLSSQGLDEDLHTTTETEDQVKSRFLLNIVVRQRTAILELLAGENETLLVRWDTLLVLNLGLNVIDGVGRFNFKSNCLSSEGLHKDLHTTTKTEDEMESGLLLDVVIRKGATVLELLACEDQALLIGWNSFLVLDLALDVVDSVRGLDLESDGLAGESLDEDLHDCGCSGVFEMYCEVW